MLVSGSSIGQRPASVDPVEEQRPEADRSVAFGSPAPSNPSRRVTRRGWLLAVPRAALLLAWMYTLTVHANSAAVNSDGATVILQGRAVASGDVLLHGWVLSLDSWWTLDVVFYGLVTAVTGVRGDLLLAGPALIAGLVVIVGAVIARRGRRGAAAAAGMVTVICRPGLAYPHAGHLPDVWPHPRQHGSVHPGRLPGTATQPLRLGLVHRRAATCRRDAG